ncbi:MAG TPA: ATP-binding protein [Polyangiaceae bacterium]|jgi:anti-sigma regulatory factor (Ser/Thr protein kinase)|nr:ATP-binding protein [Polyangiaceae bacterium]
MLQVESARGPHVELRIKPSARLISLMRRFLSDMLREVLTEAEDAWRIGLAAHELVENAFRHSIDGEVDVSIDVAEEGEGHILTLRIKNRATPEQRQTLRTHLDELSAASDALEHYLAVMRRSAQRESGLGLARVRAEADMTVSGDFDGDEVCIMARTPVRLMGATA